MNRNDSEHSFSNKIVMVMPSYLVKDDDVTDMECDNEIVSVISPKKVFYD